MTTIDQTAATTVSAARPAGSRASRGRVRATAVAGAVPATGLVWLAASGLGADFRLADSAGKAVISLPVVIAFTLIFALLGWGTLALLERFTRHAMTIWTALAVAVLALSIVPILAEHATSGTKIALGLIHLAVAVVLVPALRRTRRPGRV